MERAAKYTVEWKDEMGWHYEPVNTKRCALKLAKRQGKYKPVIRNNFTGNSSPSERDWKKWDF